jgi:hypothetical protein
MSSTLGAPRMIKYVYLFLNPRLSLLRVNHQWPVKPHRFRSQECTLVLRGLPIQVTTASSQCPTIAMSCHVIHLLGADPWGGSQLHLLYPHGLLSQGTFRIRIQDLNSIISQSCQPSMLLYLDRLQLFCLP